MQITGTHDSMTGEKGKGFLSWIVTPFARTQSVGLREQYDRGARFFDLRARLCSDGVWRGAHGLWTSRMSIEEAIDVLEEIGERVWVEITLERGNENEAAFVAMVVQLRERCRNVVIRSANVKLPQWRTLLRWDSEGCSFPLRNAHITLGGATWHIAIPIPWLWKKVYGDKEAMDGYVNLYDFI